MVGKSKSGEKSSTERSKSPGRPKSPSRNKSPGRPPKSPPKAKKDVPKRPGTPTRLVSRTKSPARPKTSSPPTTSTPIQVPKKRSPIRKSPSRGGGKESEEKDLRPRRQKTYIDTDTDSDTQEIVPEVKEKPKAAVRGRARKMDKESDIDEKLELKKAIAAAAAAEARDVTRAAAAASYSIVRRLTRSSQSRESSDKVAAKKFNPVIISKKIGDFSDEDDIREVAKDDTLTKHVEFGGALGSVIASLFIPVSVVGLYVWCGEDKCVFTGISDLQKYKRLSTYFDLKSALGLLAYFTILSLLSAFPYGGKKVAAQPSKQGKFVYVMNGLLSALVMFSICAGLEFYRIPVADYIIRHQFQLLISSICFAAIVSILLYVRSFYVPVSTLNSFAVGRNKYYAFFMGREINPRLYGVVDLKIVFFRAFLIGAALIDFVYLYKSLDLTAMRNVTAEFDPKKMNLQPTLITYVLLHFIYLLDPLIWESGWTTQFTAQQEGFGYLLTMVYATVPFFYGTIVKYIIEHGVQLEVWKLVVLTLVFIAGSVLCRGSNNQKDAFRKNPYSPTLSHLETIPTSQGKKLLASGFWGFVRHPNYLGDILVHLSLLPFVLCAPPALVVVQTVVLLLYRTYRDNNRCKIKYGAGWDRYCQKVRYAIIPKVY
ncbi:unnamed protein product [Acanthoscelides obtectus]|uniref:Uncharacterized protein n=1 Tax=Acanthoscelides obtectus TaxID=200917 RepID=A0A9P0P406_ACAOB|nr:unnamed protein product [Acanthoscelides obtectus]CAK1651704.1 Lamin-B receptor [Acanthoscelides obtectus]